MPRPTVARIDASALRFNFAVLRGALRDDVRVLAVVKADGYGHGAAIVAPVLADAGADAFGVATVAEGVELREAGISQSILVLTGAAADDVDAVHEYRLTVALADLDMARRVAARLGSRRLGVHLKIDTGMGRLGVAPSDLPSFLTHLRGLSQLEVQGVFSHLGDADDAHGEYTNVQLQRFQEAIATVRVFGFVPRAAHLANSVAALTRADTHFNLVRPGIALYGVRPPGAKVDLLPVMSLRTRIWQLKEVPAGQAISYGQTFVTKRHSRIAVLPIGYADGYDRSLSNRAAVLVRGRRAPVVGRVCMDLTLADVTDIPGAQVDDEVTLWGRDGDSQIAVEEVAQWQDSIPYEVLTRVGKRVPRVVK